MIPRLPRRLPAEWEPQAALLLAWPHESTDWASSLDVIEPVYVNLVAATAAVQPVWLLCQDSAHIEHVEQLVQTVAVDSANVRCVAIPYNDTWIRDYGPLAVASGQDWRWLDFQFDGWGGKFAAELDNQVTRQLAAAGFLDNNKVDSLKVTLEGGSIDTDGAGSLLTTDCCLLGASRNAGMKRADWEQLFAEQFGCDRTLWLEAGYLSGDDTDGHVDTLARFCSIDTIAYAGAGSDKSDPNHVELSRMAEQIKGLRQRNGKPYRLIELPSAGALQSADGDWLPASYANFIIINNRVLVPQYAAPADVEALQRLQSAFPDREIIGIDARAMLAQGGVLHCATMQLAREALIKSGLP